MIRWTGQEVLANDGYSPCLSLIFKEVFRGV